MANTAHNPPWNCPACGESVGDDYNTCWHCGTSREGEADPQFRSAVAALNTLPVADEQKALRKRVLVAIAGLFALLILLFFASYSDLTGFDLFSPGGRIFVLLIVLSLTGTFNLIVYLVHVHPSPDTADKPEDLPQVCPHCLEPIERFDHFCPHCGGPVTAHASIDPLGRIYAAGRAYQRATSVCNHWIVLLGMWPIFGPGTIITPISMVYAMLPLNSPFVIAAMGNADVMDWLTWAYAAAWTALHTVILWKVTRRYIEWRQFLARDAP